MKRAPLAPTHEQGRPDEPDYVSLVLMPNQHHPNGCTMPIEYDEYQNGVRCNYPNLTPVLFTVVDTFENREWLCRLGGVLEMAKELGLVVSVGDPNTGQRVYGGTFRPDEQGNPCTTNGVVSWGTLQVYEEQTQDTDVGKVRMMGGVYFTEYDPDRGVDSYHN